jgi:hypothetical protein
MVSVERKKDWMDGISAWLEAKNTRLLSVPRLCCGLARERSSATSYHVKDLGRNSELTELLPASHAVIFRTMKPHFNWLDQLLQHIIKNLIIHVLRIYDVITGIMETCSLAKLQRSLVTSITQRRRPKLDLSLSHDSRHSSPPSALNKGVIAGTGVRNLSCTLSSSVEDDTVSTRGS